MIPADPNAQTIPLRYFIYVLAISIATFLLLVGYLFWEGRRHQSELAAAVVTRQADVNQFLRTEVCERLELRDEIQIGYLKAAAAKYAKKDPVYSSILSDAAVALDITQQGCKQQLPRVRPPDNG